ncbi:MAG: hypothetical protein KKF46_01585 [Nanoarchaeota archaeon]|nr:hypothetical protein [Nanoarchaeota archaeon]MBU1321023.1 hypothetical protein [Nanoarchaeota archaeon]MBU1598437.1 hypothetical protein [Nanoarchaeota archaeon]MBU2441363.1 hypothetical protein [Nanoarchaeota archaeon]
MAKARTAAQKKADKTRAWKLKRRKKFNTKGQAKPKAGERSKFWVAGHTKKDGTKTKGHWRKNSNFKKKK